MFRLRLDYCSFEAGPPPNKPLKLSIGRRRPPAAERQSVGRTWRLGWSSEVERWQLLGEGESGAADLGVTFWSGRKCRWAVTSDARNTRTGIAVARGSDPWLKSRPTSR